MWAPFCRRVRVGLEHEVAHRVGFAVAEVPLVVIVRLLADGDTEDESEGGDVRRNKTNLQRGHELRKGDEEEVQVKEELELLVEDDGQERERVILLVADDVWGELLLVLL